MPTHSANDPNLAVQHYLYDTKRNLVDIRDLAILHTDGTLLATTSPKEESVEQLAQSIVILTSARGLLAAMDGGALAEVFVHGEHGYVMIFPIHSTAVLIASAVPKVKLAHMLLDLRRLAEQVAGLLV